MQTPTIIYALRDPITKEARYVGKTTLGIQTRLTNHLTQARRRGQKRYLHCWINGLIALGHKPESFELETIPVGGDWIEAERFWIAYLKSLGARLTNITEGGDVGSKGFRHSMESRRRMSEWQIGRKMPRDGVERAAAAKRGWKMSDEQKRTISQVHLGRKHTAKTRAKMSAAQKARPPKSVATREKISAALRGRTLPPEVRAKLSAIRKGKKKPPSYSEKLSLRRRGVKASEETRAKLRAAWLRRKQRIGMEA